MNQETDIVKGLKSGRDTADDENTPDNPLKKLWYLKLSKSIIYEK